VNALYCLEEWRGGQRISPPGDNFTPSGAKFTPGEQLRSWGRILPLGAKLTMGLRLGDFSPDGLLFNVGRLSKSKEVAKMFGLLF
jgi:hypothetical protein